MKHGIKRKRGEASGVGSRTVQAMGRGAIAGARVGGLVGMSVGGGLALIGGALVAADYLRAQKERDKCENVLDNPTLAYLRHEAQNGKHCSRIERGNTRGVKLRPSSKGFFSNDGADIAGYLQFAHAPQGKWKLKLITLPDAYDALMDFRRVVGADQVESQFPF